MKILKREFDDLPGLGKPEWETSTISVSVTHEMIEDVTSMGLDALELVEDAVANEVFYGLARLISKTSRNKRPEEIKWSRDSAYWLSDLLLKGNPKFIIVNLKVGVALQMMKSFVAAPINTSFPPGNLYLLGKFDGIDIYVDPNMLYSENELVIIENDFLEYEVDEETVKLITEGTMAPRISINYRYKLHYPKSKLYLINNIEI